MDWPWLGGKESWDLTHSLAQYAIGTFTSVSCMPDLDGSSRNVDRRYSLVPHATDEEAFPKTMLIYHSLRWSRGLFPINKFFEIWVGVQETRKRDTAWA